MSNHSSRIEVGGAGVGESSQADIDRRALELARSDSRTEPNEIDFIQARRELGGEIPTGDGDAADAIAEDDRPGSGLPSVDEGTRAERFKLDDEQSAAELLVEEGIAEAEHDSRLHSNDDL